MNQQNGFKCSCNASSAIGSQNVTLKGVTYCDAGCPALKAVRAEVRAAKAAAAAKAADDRALKATKVAKRAADSAFGRQQAVTGRKPAHRKGRPSGQPASVKLARVNPASSAKAAKMAAEAQAFRATLAAGIF